MEENENKLYVGNLSYRIDEEQLNNFFEEKGVPVQSVTIIREKFTERSKGFGFVVVSSPEEVGKAIDTVNGQDLDGRTLTVGKARAREERPRSSRPQQHMRGRRGGGGPHWRTSRKRY